MIKLIKFHLKNLKFFLKCKTVEFNDFIFTQSIIIIIINFDSYFISSLKYFVRFNNFL